MVASSDAAIVAKAAELREFAWTVLDQDIHGLVRIANTRDGTRYDVKAIHVVAVLDEIGLALT